MLLHIFDQNPTVRNVVFIMTNVYKVLLGGAQYFPFHPRLPPFTLLFVKKSNRKRYADFTTYSQKALEKPPAQESLFSDDFLGPCAGTRHLEHDESIRFAKADVPWT